MGEFEDWDQVLDGLAERGYNAIRIDCFPHLVATNGKGEVEHEFYNKRDDWTPALWGNQYSIRSRPREALLEFLPKCQDRGIQIGLATWFAPHGTHRNEQVEGLEGFIRVWDETLSFLQRHDLLQNILYVDLLNEYPLWHGFDWFKKAINALSKSDSNMKIKADAHIQDAKTERYNPEQQQFYKTFMKDAIAGLKAKWPHLRFFTSQSNAPEVPWQNMDFTGFSHLDAHIWFVHHKLFRECTSYYSDVHTSASDRGYEKVCQEIEACWTKHRATLIDWMDGELKKRADLALQYGIPCGNTEGWGPINWSDHPALNWNFTKEAGEVCVDLALRHGFAFICTSNFTHPQFPGIWNDIEWHQRLTERIRQGSAAMI